jgi:lysophospholipase L1-like esterase
MNFPSDKKDAGAVQAVPARRGFLQRVAAASALGAAGLASANNVLADSREGERSHDHGRGNDWITTWAASAHGTYPLGTAVAQPDLQFAFPDAATGASNQSFRLIIRPTVWGDQFRLRFSNLFGNRAVTFDDLHLGLQASAGTLVEGSNTRITFQGARQVTIPAGEALWSDPVRIGHLKAAGSDLLQGRKLAVSFHVVGSSGPMTWHSKAMQTSYVTAPNSGSHAAAETDRNFPYSTSSWYFLDAVDVAGPRNAATIVTFGDSITDGTGSTLNGDDRWPDVLMRRLHAAHGNRFAVANAGIGGNRIVTDSPTGGPAAVSRLEQDVLSLSGVVGIVWFEGINDLRGGTSAQEIIAGIRQGVTLLRARSPGIVIVQGTITSDVGNATTTPAVEAGRQEVNAFIRTAGIFDGIVDFDAITADPATGELRLEFQPNSTTAAIDKLHPNRAGYLAMGSAVDIRLLTSGSPVKRNP